MNDSSSLSTSSDDFPTPQGARWNRPVARSKTTGNGVSTLQAVPRSVPQKQAWAPPAPPADEPSTQRKLQYDASHSTVCSIEVDKESPGTTIEDIVPLDSLRRLRDSFVTHHHKAAVGSEPQTRPKQLHESPDRVTDAAATQPENQVHTQRLSHPKDARNITVSSVDVASEMTPQKDLQKVVLEQEERIRDLVKVLQEASAEIKRERRLREKQKEEYDRLRNGKEGIASAAMVSMKLDNETLAREVQRLRASEARQSEMYGQKLETMRNALQHVEKMREEEVEEAMRNREQIDALQDEVRRMKESARQRHVHQIGTKVNEDAQLVERMKRALAPPPDPESMAVLIDSMVRELKRLWREENKELLLIKRGRNLYSFGERKLNLQLVNGKLAYRAGGGHKDLLTFLETQERSRRAIVQHVPLM